MKQEKQNSVEKATEEQSPQAAPQKITPQTQSGSKPKSIQQWDDLVSGRIEEAMQRGAFDNLPGHGKPLNLRRNPYTPDDQQMAFNLLEDNNLAPEWIGDRKQLQADIDALRSQIAQKSAQIQAGFLSTSAQEHERWQGEGKYYLGRWQTEIEKLNKRIKTLNLKQPFAYLELFILKPEEELAHLNRAWLNESSE